MNESGLPAADIHLPNPILDFDSQGRLLALTTNKLLYRLESTGILNVIYGCLGDQCVGGTSGSVPATKRELASILYDFEPMPNGDMYFMIWSGGLQKASLPSTFASMLKDGEAAYADDNGLSYIMGPDGRHLRTIDQETGVTLHTFEYDGEGRLLSMTDRFDEATTIERDAKGTAIAVVSSDSTGNQRTELAHDANGNLTTVTYEDNTSFGFEYETGALITTKVDQRGNRFTHEFDENGRVVKVSDPMGGFTTFERSYADGVESFVISTAEGLTTTYGDSTPTDGGYGSEITDAAGGVTTYQESQDGMYVEKSMACGTDLTAEYEYDLETGLKYTKRMTQRTNGCEDNPDVECLERVVETGRTYEDTDGDGAWDVKTETSTVNGKTSTVALDKTTGTVTSTSAEGRTATSTFDPSTLLTMSSSVPGVVDTTYEYDSEGRRTKVLAGERSVSYEYDLRGNLIAMTGSDGKTVRYTRDLLGRITEIERADASTVGFEYDANGNMTKLTTPSGAEHVYNYNAVNAKDQYDTPLVNQYRYIYDLDRRLVEAQYPSGKKVENIYDGAQLMTVRLPEGDVNLTYECSAKVASVTFGDESVSYSYNGSFITSEILAGTLAQTLGYSYNEDFQLEAFKYAGLTVNYAYDNDGMLTTAGDFTVARNAANGLPESISDGAMTTSRVFNEYGELANQSTNVAGNDIYSWTLERDANGQITKKTEVLAGTTQVYDYLYDDFGRLLEVKLGGAVVESYTYGPNGARISETNTRRGVTGKAYAYSEEDHLLTAGDATYEYDVDGFLTKKTENGQETFYTYSTRGALLRVILPDGKVIEYVVDPYGRRIAKKVDGIITEKYLWQGLTRLLAVFDGVDALKYRFEYGDGRMPVAVEDAGVKKYLVYDQVGSLRAVVDAAGNVLRAAEYDSFGNILSAAGEAFDVFAFAGGLYDADTGLIRFGYRDYDPTVGRWTAKDPIGFAGGDSDLYGYCLGDPVIFIDDKGLSPSAAAAAAKAAAKAAFKYLNKNKGNIGTGAKKGVSPIGLGELLGSCAGIALCAAIPAPGARMACGAAGGFAGGAVGKIFDPPSAGDLNYNHAHDLWTNTTPVLEKCIMMTEDDCKALEERELWRGAM